ncbi:MAG: hypothetical protein JSU94_13050 [Phycisphaerales bacterium]|nr:MAG: hypothetical protein JSU94_13050 [Phycisphaerales bacterium]
MGGEGAVSGAIRSTVVASVIRRWSGVTEEARRRGGRVELVGQVGLVGEVGQVGLVGEVGRVGLVGRVGVIGRRVSLGVGVIGSMALEGVAI